MDLCASSFKSKHCRCISPQANSTWTNLTSNNSGPRPSKNNWHICRSMPARPRVSFGRLKLATPRLNKAQQRFLACPRAKGQRQHCEFQELQMLQHSLQQRHPLCPWLDPVDPSNIEYSSKCQVHHSASPYHRITMLSHVTLFNPTGMQRRALRLVFEIGKLTIWGNWKFGDEKRPRLGEFHAGWQTSRGQIISNHHRLRQTSIHHIPTGACKTPRTMQMSNV